MQLRALGYVGESAEGELPTDDIKSRREMMELIQSGALGYDPRVVMERLDEWEALWGRLPPIDEMRLMMLDFMGRHAEAEALAVLAERMTLPARIGDEKWAGRAGGVALAIGRALRTTQTTRPHMPTWR